MCSQIWTPLSDVDGLEGTAVLGGSVRLEVPHVDVRRAASQHDVDNGLWPARGSGGRFTAEDVGQSQAADAQCSDAQEVAAGVAAAIGLALSGDREHA
jgi:hypothetical protein